MNLPLFKTLFFEHIQTRTKKLKLRFGQRWTSRWKPRADCHRWTSGRHDGSLELIVIGGRHDGSLELIVIGGRHDGSLELIVIGGRHDGSLELIVIGGHHDGSLELIVIGGRHDGSLELIVIGGRHDGSLELIVIGGRMVSLMKTNFSLMVVRAQLLKGADCLASTGSGL